MSGAIVRSGLAEGWRGLMAAAVVVGAMVLLGLYVYQDIDLSIYEALPQAMQSLMGIPEHADFAVLAYNEMLASVGALVLVGVAVALGTRAIAGEEDARTLHLVLSTPVSRTSYALGKAAALVLLIVSAGAFVWGTAELAPRLLQIDVGHARLFALMAHLTACALFHGALSFSVGALTGRKAVAGGVGGAVMVLGWVGAGLLPMQPDLKWVADYLPWTWFNASRPLVEGVDGKHLALLLGGAVALVIAGIVGFEKRELRQQREGVSLKVRLSRMPGMSMLGTAAGHGRSLLGLWLRAGRTLVLMVALVMALLMGLAMGPMYASMKNELIYFAASYPKSLVAMFGGGDIATDAGFLHFQTMAMMGPIAVIVVAVSTSTSSVAGEEGARRLAVVLAQPISRLRVYWTAATAMAIQVAVVVAATFLGLWGGVLLADLRLAPARIAAACGLLACLGWCFGALALALSAGTGRARVALWGSSSIAVVSYFGYTLLDVAGHANWGWWSPMRAYLYGPPLEYGIQWWQPVWLLVAMSAFLLLGAVIFTRRSLR